MCRIITIIGKNNQEDKKTLLENFRLLAKNGAVPRGVPSGHRDGWGMVSYDKNKINYFQRSVKAADTDSKFIRSTDKIIKRSNNLIIAHLRKSTMGRNYLANTHPFVYKNFSFCHNGTVFNSQNLPLTKNYRKLSKGQSDSEKIFFLILQNFRADKGRDIAQAIKKTVYYIEKNNDYTALVFLFCDGRNLWAARFVNLRNKFVKGKNLIDYYILYIGENKKQKLLLLSSEKIKKKGIIWRPLKNRQLLKISLTK